MGKKGTRLIVQFLHSNPFPPKDPRGVLGRWWLVALGWLTPEWLLWFAAIHQVTGGRGRGNIHQTAFVPDRCAKTLLPCALSSKIGFKRCVCVCAWVTQLEIGPVAWWGGILLQLACCTSESVLLSGVECDCSVGMSCYAIVLHPIKRSKITTTDIDHSSCNYALSMQLIAETSVRVCSCEQMVW